MLDKIDLDDTIKKYQKHFADFGYSPKALGWDKGRQEIRFNSLLSFFDCAGKSILDIGCGFGDLNKSLQKKYADNYTYTGIDIVDDLLSEGEKRYASKHVKFISGNFLDYEFTEKFDIIVASGIFNHKFKKSDNYAFIESVMGKAKLLCIDGFAFDFLSDKVDYQHDHTFHSSPEKILSYGYELSRNLILRNDCLPFEFTLCIYSNDSFDKSTAVFDRYYEKLVVGQN